MAGALVLFVCVKPQIDADAVKIGNVGNYCSWDVIYFWETRSCVVMVCSPRSGIMIIGLVLFLWNCLRDNHEMISDEMAGCDDAMLLFALQIAL